VRRAQLLDGRLNVARERPDLVAEGVDDAAEELLRCPLGRAERFGAGQKVSCRRTEVAGDLVGVYERLVRGSERRRQEPDRLTEGLLVVSKRPEELPGRVHPTRH